MQIVEVDKNHRTDLHRYTEGNEELLFIDQFIDYAQQEPDSRLFDVPAECEQLLH